MSFSTLFTGISGMNAMGKGLSVVGDNIANMNTVGFKSSKVAFTDILGSTIAGGEGQVGRGVMVSDVTKNYAQGTFEMSSNYLDLAVDGEGFFVVGNTTGNNNGKYFTRAGQFKLDREGRIVNAKGYVLQGYKSDDNGTITEEVADLLIAPKQKEAKATTKVTFGLNLDTRQKPPENRVFNSSDAKTYNFSSQFVSYDSQGDAHQVTAYFVKNPPPIAGQEAGATPGATPGAPPGAVPGTAGASTGGQNNWTVYYVYSSPQGALPPGTQPPGTPPPGTPALDAQGLPVPPGTMVVGVPNADGFVLAGTQTLQFGQNGELINDNSKTAIPFNFGAKVKPSSINFEFGEGVAEGSETGFLGTVQLAADFAVHELFQDGYTTGSLQSLNINKEGKISALFGNGQTRILGQVVLAKFTAPTELARVGENMLAETYDSGDAIISGAASNSLGKVLSNTLELSNVDLSEEFVRMISFQRAFQANTRTITTTDEMLQEVLTLKR